jgi:hypothetical protein
VRLAPFARRVVVRVGRLLRRTLRIGTFFRFTRMRVQVDERPRIESTSTSSGASFAATSGCRAFQRSSPASASALLGEFAITSSGMRARGAFFFAPRPFARDGATRAASPSNLR